MWDPRYREHLFGWRWCFPDYMRLPSPLRRLLGNWEQQMIQTEDRLTNVDLAIAHERIQLDFCMNTLSRLFKGDDWFFECIRHPRPSSDKERIEHCQEELIDYAKLYLRAAEKHGERCIETSFMTWFRGACAEEDNGNEWYPKMPWVDMMNEFPLGFVLSTQLCHQSAFSYMAQHVKDRLVQALWVQSRCLMEIKNGTYNDDPFPSPPTAAPSSPEPKEPVRAHEKAPRALKWSGSRQREVETRKSNALPRSDEGKAESIAAGKARARALRAAERARVAEQVERARIVSLGYEIGQGRD